MSFSRAAVRNSGESVAPDRALSAPGAAWAVRATRWGGPSPRLGGFSAAAVGLGERPGVPGRGRGALGIRAGLSGFPNPGPRGGGRDRLQSWGTVGSGGCVVAGRGALGSEGSRGVLRPRCVRRSLDQLCPVVSLQVSGSLVSPWSEGYDSCPAYLGR